MFGYVVYYYGEPVSFVAKHLKVVALSSAEAEYAAASYACKEIVFVRKLLTDLGYPPVGPVTLCVDNRAAINIAENMGVCLLYTSPSPRDVEESRMPSSA